MRLLITAPSNNERGPRYMEKALAAIHQGDFASLPITFEYTATDSDVGLYCRFPNVLENVVLGPILANYPQCTASIVEEPTLNNATDDWETLTANLSLIPELFPILRHAQFEDLLTGNFADPIDSLLKSIQPNSRLRSSIEITVVPARPLPLMWARQAVRRLDRPFFRSHVRLGHWFARHITRRPLWPIAWLVGFLAAKRDHPLHNVLEVSAGRHHEREDDLQAASEKLGGHLFEAEIRLRVRARVGNRIQARERLQLMAGAFGAFTKSRLAMFEMSDIRQDGRVRSRNPIRRTLTQAVA